MYIVFPQFKREERINADWPELRTQLLTQWNRISPQELDNAGPDNRRIAQLVEREYGIPSRQVQIYLFNFERRMAA